MAWQNKKVIYKPKINKYLLWKVLKSQNVAITHLVIGKDSPVTHHVVALEKAAEQHILIALKAILFE